MDNAKPIPPDLGAAEAESVRRGHEVRDASVRACVIFLVVMFAVIGLIHWGLVGLLHHDRAKNTAEDEPANLWTGKQRPPVAPRLQPSPGQPENPSVDMEALEAKWRQALTTAGPSASGEPYVRVPVSEAMERAVREGLPRPATQQAGGGR